LAASASIRERAHAVWGIDSSAVCRLGSVAL
jgi:hypothetical protein